MGNPRQLALVASLLLSGCSSTTSHATLQDVTKKFSDTVAAQSSALATELTNRRRVRRHEALEYFVNDPAVFEKMNDNYRSAFAEYVCTGDNAFQKAQSFLALAKSYAAKSQQITTPGADTFAGQLAKYEELNHTTETKDPIKEPKPPSCANTVKMYLEFKGVAPAKQEELVAEVAAAYEAFNALFELETVAKDGLKMVNEVEARQRLRAYVEKMHDPFLTTMTTNFPPSVVSDAWDRRKAQSLWAPYLTFAELVKERGTAKPLDIQQQYGIKELALKLDGELAEFDTMSVTKPPADLVKSMGIAEQAVYDAARDDKISLDTIIAFLDEAISDAKTAQADYKNVETAAGNAKTAISNVVH